MVNNVLEGLQLLTQSLRVTKKNKQKSSLVFVFKRIMLQLSLIKKTENKDEKSRS
jgi:hypothetical protein